MNHSGPPIYCETGHPWLFMAEPVNTITNIFIIVAAVMATRYVQRAKIGRPWDLVVLLFLLFSVGIGSFAWHAFRTRLALTFDALPGLLFLLVLAGLWFRALFGTAWGVIGTLGMIAAAVGATILWRRYAFDFHDMPPALVFAPAFICIAAIGAFLAIATVPRYGMEIARLGAFALASGVIAAVCRSIDQLVCSTIPIGVHFVWHVMLSVAAYLGIVMLTKMKLARGPY